MSFRILGTGHAHPGFSLSNSELADFVDTSDEWITSRTGIRSRFVSTGETMFEFSLAAAKMALERSAVDPGGLDLIICTTIEGDYLTPALACQLQAELGAECPAFDLNAACSGFVYALETAAAFFDSGRAKTILVVSAEMMSKHTDWADRSTCVLFGDGAGAAVLGKGEGLLSIRITAKGDPNSLFIPARGGKTPFGVTQNKIAVVNMQGAQVYKFAVNSICRDVQAVMERAGIKTEQVKKFIPHQANIRIISAASKALGFSRGQTAVNIERYGNTSSASVPILLSELLAGGEAVAGDIIVMAAMGGGLTSGACAVRL